MKNILKLTSIVLLFVATFTSCSESDTVADYIRNNVDTETGYILRVKEVANQLITINETTNPNWTNEPYRYFEVQQGNGSFVPEFKEVRVYVGFFGDQDFAEPLNFLDGTPMSEVLMQTITSGEFENSDDTGLPNYDFTHFTTDFLDLFPDLDVPSSESYIRLRYELELNDGTIINEEYVNENVAGGNYFHSAFRSTMVLIPI